MSEQLTASLLAQVSEFRLKARNILRQAKINNLLGYIHNVETKIAGLEEEKKGKEKSAAIAIYELNNEVKLMGEDHPDIESIKERTNKIIENINTELKEYIEAYTKEKDGYNEKIKEYNDKITGWETGDRKVSIEDLNKLTEDMILNQK